MLEILFKEGQSGLGISDRAQQILRDQHIRNNGPGTVLADFESMLRFIGNEGLKTTGKYCLLPQSKLDELNLKMSRPVMHRLKRPQQRSFPHLHGLYLILRASGMGIVGGSRPSGGLVLDQEAVMSWRELNATEQYFALLEAWLVQAVPELIAERGGAASSCMRSLNDIAIRLRERRTVGDHRRRGGLLYDVMDSTTVALMELFGWVRLEFGEPAAGEGVRITAVERLDFGDAMVAVLHNGYMNREWPTYIDETPADPGALRPLFQPYFPDYKRAMEAKELPYLEGTLMFRVSLGNAWRRIAAPDDATLDDLARTILDAFEFEMDHLYCFELRQTNGRKLVIACPDENDAVAFTDDFALGQLPIAEGGTMTMIFDYGTSWHFSVKFEEISCSAKTHCPRVVAKGGKPPAQYDWEDEEDWE
jgi:hypothetical protein